MVLVRISRDNRCMVTVISLNANEISALLEKGHVTMGDPASGLTIRLEEVDDSTPDEKPKHEKKGWWKPVAYDLNDIVKAYKDYDTPPPKPEHSYHYHPHYAPKPLY